MATFSSLKTKVQNRIIDSPTLITTEVGDLVNSAMADLQEAHSFRVMEALLEATTTASSHTLVAKPGNWKSDRGKPWWLDVRGDKHPMDWAASREEVLVHYAQDSTTDVGDPKALLLGEPEDEANAQTILVFPYPDGNSEQSDGEYRVKIPYWKYLADLSNDADENWFTQDKHGANYIVFKATAEGFVGIWDEERSAVWETKAAAELRKIIRRDKLSRITSTRSFSYSENAGLN